MQSGDAPHQTHLFRLRLWQERIGDDAFEWRGQVTRVDTGDVRAFRTWAQLVDALAAMVGAEACGGKFR
jgi:hypothetical protein